MFLANYSRCLILLPSIDPFSGNLQVEVFANGLEGIGFVEGIEVQPWNTEFDQPFTLACCIVNAQLNSSFVVVLNLNQFPFQLRRNLRAAERCEPTNL